MGTNSIYLSIIIPAYNELKNFQRGALKEVQKYLRTVQYAYEVIVVDDGSNDASQDKISAFCRRNKNFYLLQRPHLGKAAAIYAGVQKAKGKLILFTDFDQATPLSEVEKLLAFIHKGYDICIGSREIQGAKREKEPFYRHLMGRVFNLVVKSLAFGGIADTQCGFKLFKAKAAKHLFNRLRVYDVRLKTGSLKHAFTGAVDVELLFLASKFNYKIAEVPVYWRHYKTDRVNPIRDSLKMFIDVLKIRLFDLLGAYVNP